MIKNILDKYPYVSFDVFDTLLERKCLTPENIFYETGQKIIGEGFFFKRVRQEAEKKAYQEYGAKTNLNQIYSYIDNFDNATLCELKREEIAQEIENCYPKKNISALYNYIEKHKKHVLIISDMYLSADTILKMLKKAGYENFDKLYVSNEIGVDKRSGKLFQYVLKDQKITSGQLIHIGDSIRADFLGARKESIKSIFIPKKKIIVRKIKNVL